MNKGYNLRFKPILLMLGILFCVMNGNNLQAQTIIDELQSQTNSSDGLIRIECDSAIVTLIGKPNPQMAANDNSNFVERNGYRIQVFMGNVNTQSTRSEADSKQAAIQNAFPELFTYLRFESPNFRLLVGDFLNREEANLYIQRLRKEFPSFGKEMYIVTDKIRLFIER